MSTATIETLRVVVIGAPGWSGTFAEFVARNPHLSLADIQRAATEVENGRTFYFYEQGRAALSAVRREVVS